MIDPSRSSCGRVLCKHLGSFACFLAVLVVEMAVVVVPILPHSSYSFRANAWQAYISRVDEANCRAPRDAFLVHSPRSKRTKIESNYTSIGTRIGRGWIFVEEEFRRSFSMPEAVGKLLERCLTTLPITPFFLPDLAGLGHCALTRISQPLVLAHRSLSFP